MTHSFLTSAIPIEEERVAAVNAALDAMGNPATKEIRDAMREDLQIHFVSIGAISGDGAAKGHLVIEASSDASPGDTIQLLLTRLDPWLKPVFAAADLPAPDFVRLLSDHIVTSGTRLRDNAGLDFTGTPGMTVKRIRREYDLARKVRTLFDDNTYKGSAVEVLAQVRAEVAKDPKLAPLLTLEPAPFLIETKETSVLASAPALIGGAIVRFFWPLLLVCLLLSLAAVAAAWYWSGWVSAVLTLLVAAGVVVVVLVLRLVFIFLNLTALEKADIQDDSIPNEAVLREVVRRENKVMQNHMTGVSRIKPARLRRFTLKLAFYVIGSLSSKFRPGYLSDIGTINFARWVVLPGTDQLIFFSNYGGSWESYLEDFVTKAHEGLTGIWSNTEGYPKSSTLFFDGATAAEPFLRWARRQHRPTYFWYSGYPHLTTDRIRSNAAIRQGLAGASTEDEAKAWLANLGSRMPPPSALDTTEIQTIVFGGLKHHPYGASLLLALPGERQAARGWLAETAKQVSFGDEPDPENVTLLALSASGLRRLGLDESQLATFPFAFRMGMDDPIRSNILSDTGDDKPAHWIWGNDQADRKVDAALLLYARRASMLTDAVDAAARAIAGAGGAVVHRVDFRPLEDEARESGHDPRSRVKEAFGFADGVSQPIIKGTRRWLKETDAIHTVEPGEFLLGYPDNRGGHVFSPLVRSGDDPHNLLPVVDPAYANAHYPSVDKSNADRDRDLGRNGSYLVVRQLAQDVEAFCESVAQAAEHCKEHPGMPPELEEQWQREQWVAAKMIGRWRDGTSLVRYPHRPGTGWNAEAPNENGPIPVEPDNGFLLGAEDPIGHRCPFGAHVRRTNPRETLTPGSMEQLAINNRHRILRIGRRYDGYKNDGNSESEGLFFMCLNSELERQFEFIQQTWVMAMQFMGVENEVDSILGRGKKKDGDTRKLARLTIPTPHGPIYVRDLRDVVTVRGGGYFFLPSKSALAWLSAPLPG